MTDTTIDHLRSAVDAEYNYWKARAEAAEAEVKRLRAALYGITNPDGQDGEREVKRLRHIAETALGKKP